MPSPGEPELSAVVIEHLADIAAGRCSITDQEIDKAARTDPFLAEILTGLLFLHEDLALRVTERRRSEEALRESERRTRLILDTAYEAFISIDADGRIVDWNAAAERVFGWPRAEAVGRLLADTIIPERYRAAHTRGLEHYRATGEGPLLERLVEIEAVRRDGSERSVELTIWPVQLGSTVVFNALLRDVTERKQLGEALRDAKEAAEHARETAERANQAKSEFLSRMSHELRTPLNAILGFAQLLEIDAPSPEHRDSVEQILRGGRHLLGLIDDVLDVAKIEQGQVTLVIEPVPVDDVVRASLELVSPQASAANVPIRLATPQIGRDVLADRRRLTQVLVNLLSNAIKYNRAGGQVTISSERMPSGRLRVAVTDTGHGIPPDRMAYLFRPFERLGAERTAVEGTGIGLSISKRLMELMGGTIGADSEPGRGSTFWVELGPAGTAAAPDEPAAAAEPQAPSGVSGERTVLYVEDNLSNLRLVERVLAQRPQTRLVAATRGGAAVDLACEHHPDLILLDVHLPDISGDEVLRQLRAVSETRDIPVVVVSAEATQAKIDRFLAAGARAYLTKPLDVKQFLTLVDRILAEATR